MVLVRLGQWAVGEGEQGPGAAADVAVAVRGAGSERVRGAGRALHRLRSARAADARHGVPRAVHRADRARTPRQPYRRRATGECHIFFSLLIYTNDHISLF